MNDRRRINPQLIAAIEYYAEGRYNLMEPSLYVHTDENGFQHLWSVERACGVAAEVLANEDLAYLKLKTLKDGIRKAGMERFYEYIMGQKMEDEP